MKRIKFALQVSIVKFTIILLLAALAGENFAAEKKVLILGVDGLDPKLLAQFVEEGSLPNFEKLIADGDFKPLQTSMPPLSPVAWSTFITGMDPGGHGIFDFIHRNPKTMLPELSTSRVVKAERNLQLGSWVLPLSQGKIEQLRKGRAFWQILEDEGVPTTISQMPANFPPSESTGKSFSGMGTPDIMGTPGTFSFYTTDVPENADEISGGQVLQVEVMNHRVQAQLIGPENPFRKLPRGKGRRGAASPKLTIDFQVFLDPENPVAKLVVQDNEFILQEGEWSDWIRVDFEALPLLANVSAIGRFYLQEIRPEFRLYVTPLQINPEDPAMAISTPEDYAHELFENLGYFYTQGLPEDTKAFSSGIFNGREFWQQSQLVLKERTKAIDYFLENFDAGLLFFYFSSVDQGSHMLWHFMDQQHPAFEYDEILQNGIRTLYQEIDAALGKAMRAIDGETTLIVMSDHGFSPFYWEVNLNSWLLEKGYIVLKDPARQGEMPFFQNVDWHETKAYALGLNGIYVNLEGRERTGIISEFDYQYLLDQLENDLLEMRDPRNGNQVVTLVTQCRRDFDGPYLDVGPDIIIGYNSGYRSSWKSPLGEFPKEIFVDNKDPWSGDHSIDYRKVPGVLLTNKKITLDNPALYDLTVAVLDEFGVAKLPEMIGQDCLK